MRSSYATVTGKRYAAPCNLLKEKVTCGSFLWRKLLESTVEGENWASHSEENDLEFEFWDLKYEKSTQSAVHHRHSHRHHHHHHHHHMAQRNGFHSGLLLLTLNQLIKYLHPNSVLFFCHLTSLIFGLPLLLFFLVETNLVLFSTCHRKVRGVLVTQNIHEYNFIYIYIYIYINFYRPQVL